MSAINYQCKELVFHFNKKHLEDPTVPMWILKAHGVTFYVNHVDAEIPWSTKETPDNSHTKGSLKFKKCKLTIDENNNATISKLGLLDLTLPTPKVAQTRIIAGFNSSFHGALKKDEFQHSKIKEVTGGCGSSFIVCDLLDKDEEILARLKYANDFRILSPNEGYYKEYDKAGDFIYENDEYEELYED
ncbi:MAG TPA: hypothetical protein VFM18_19400 [Methanosarcina sp.]|nr:hypothetical protein [Methanosarcina sp.]